MQHPTIPHKGTYKDALTRAETDGEQATTEALLAAAFPSWVITHHDGSWGIETTRSSRQAAIHLTEDGAPDVRLMDASTASRDIHPSLEVAIEAIADHLDPMADLTAQLVRHQQAVQWHKDQWGQALAARASVAERMVEDGASKYSIAKLLGMSETAVTNMLR